MNVSANGSWSVGIFVFVFLQKMIRISIFPLSLLFSDFEQFWTSFYSIFLKKTLSHLICSFPLHFLSADLFSLSGGVNFDPINLSFCPYDGEPHNGRGP